MSVFETYQQRMEYAAMLRDCESIMATTSEATADEGLTIRERVDILFLCFRLRKAIRKGGVPA